MWNVWRKWWPRSLWWRLIAAFALVIFLGASGVIFLVSQVTTREFDLYVTRDSARWAAWLAPQLAWYYNRTGSWQGVQEFLAFGGGMPMMMDMEGMFSEEMRRMHQRMMGQMPSMSASDMWTGMGLRVVVADAQGLVVADTQQVWVGKPLPSAIMEQALPVSANGRTVGFVLVAPLPRRDTPEMLFLEATIRAVVWVGLGVGLLALVLAAVLTRQITAPLRQLVAAAHRIATGDLSVRVPVDGDDELAHVARAFNRMAGALSRQQELRRQLMNDIAHELRTPLSVIQAQVEALLDGVFPPTPDNLEPIYEQTRLLTRLVNDLRELALAEAGELEMSRDPLDLARVIMRGLAGLRPVAEQKGVALVAEGLNQALWVQGDAQRLEQVLLNLLSNAVRHTPSGGRVIVRAWREGSRVYCQVEDPGTGIPPEQLPYIFERFWRGDPSRSRVTGGTGLGLAIARKLVEAHGGRIWAESPPGKGAVFTFWLPASPTP